MIMISNKFIINTEHESMKAVLSTITHLLHFPFILTHNHTFGKLDYFVSGFRHII